MAIAKKSIGKAIGTYLLLSANRLFDVVSPALANKHVF